MPYSLACRLAARTTAFAPKFHHLRHSRSLSVRWRKCWRLRSRINTYRVSSTRTTANFECDVLVVDATNLIAGVVAADRRRLANIHRRTIVSDFAEWMSFLKQISGPDLVLACFDTPRAARKGVNQRQSLEPNYLKRRGRKLSTRDETGRQSQQPGNAPIQRKDALTALYPFLAHLDSVGALSVVAKDGWEADDCVGAACALIQESQPSLCIAVASADSDMQQLLTPQVSWMHLLPGPTLDHPLGIDLVTAQDFKELQGFPPQAYPDWLAFVGKRDSGVGGVGTGASTAAKLLRRYGSIEGVESAAGRGELDGWSPAVQRLFGRGGGGADAEAKRDLLHRNRQVLSINCSLAVLGKEEVANIERHAERVAKHRQGREERGAAPCFSASHRTGAQAGVRRGAPGGSSSQGGLQAEPSVSPQVECTGSKACGRAHAGGGGAEDGLGVGLQACTSASELAWAYPLHATRWRFIEGHASWLLERLQEQGVGAAAHTASPLGVPVDILVHAGHQLLGINEGPVAVLVAGACDFQRPGVPPVEECKPDERGSQVWGVLGSPEASRACVRQLNGAMQQHVKLLRKDGLAVVCVPVWQLQHDQGLEGNGGDCEETEV